MKNEYNISREIKRLKGIRGYGTELISVYIPAGYPISEEVSKLREEHSQSSNIKSKSVRNNVQSALEKIMQYLKLYKETPKNGLAIFCGNVSTNSGKVEIEIFSMEPPIPLKVNIYRCESTFLLDPIEEIVGSKDTYVLLVMDGREATVATLKGSHIQIIKRLNSMVHAKVGKGGQSQARFVRQREETIGEYHTRVSDIINSTFISSEFKIKGLIVGGPGPAKESFLKQNSLNYQIKVLGTYDTGYTDEFGLHEMIEKATDLLKEQEAYQERKVIERFMQEIVRKALAVYGYEETKHALVANQVNTLIINDALEIHEIKYKCNADNTFFSVIEYGGHIESKHAVDGGTLDVADDKDMIEELIGVADKNGAETVFVSSESSYGREFLMGFKGIGALLRYKI